MTESTYIDKSTWGDGPWQDEPDSIEWTDGETGLACVMRRSKSGGHWCGYVGVEPDHPAHGMEYSAIEAPDPEHPYIDVHGGLTWAGESAGDFEPEEARWWFGFGCHHAWDIAPASEVRDRAMGYPTETDKTYRDREYVQREVTSLAKRLAAVQ